MTTNREYEEFPESKIVAKILVDSGLMTEENLNDVINTPEFQIFQIIGENFVISTEQIEAKYETPTLSMILSNLQADNLIEQTNDYRWKLTNYAINLFNTESTTINYNEIKQIEKIEDQEINLEDKKALYMKLAGYLKETSYIPTYYTVEDLFEISELEILAIIYQHQPLDTDEIDKMKKLDTSVSLALSNLQADNLIKQNPEYKWKLSDNFFALITSSETSLTDGEELLNKTGTGSILSSEQARIIEHKQLLKALIDINYFQNKPVKEVMYTPEFEVLNIINSFSPVGSEDIEKMIHHDIPLSMILSNLKADGLIEQQNDYRWIIEENFSIQISKKKVSQDELIKQIREEEKVKSEPAEMKNDQKTPIFPESKIVKSVKSFPIDKKSEIKKFSNDPIIQALYKFEYISDPNLPQSELSEYPEYNVLKLLSKSPPLSSDELELKIETSSLSLILSNLSADGIIKQTNDYRYSLTPEYGGTVEELQLVKKNNLNNNLGLKKENIIEKGENTSLSTDKRKEMFQQAIDEYKQKEKEKRSFEDIKRSEKLVEFLELDHLVNEEIDELMKVPEFEILWHLSKAGTLTEDQLKKKCHTTSPAIISHIVKQLFEIGKLIKTTKGELEISFN